MATSLKNEKENDSGAFLNVSTDKWYSYTSTRETTRSWPKIITNFDEVPDFFKDHIHIESNKFPYSILIPENIESDFFMPKKTNPKLLSLYNDRIEILEKNTNTVEKITHYFYEISYMEIKNILLFSSINFVSVHNASRIFFNSVRFDFFKIIIETVRRYYVKTENNEDIRSKNEEKVFEYYSAGRINHKFMNYAMDGLLPGQSIKKLLFQEPVKVRCFNNKFSNWIYNHTSPALLILTLNELILMQEPYKIRRNKSNEYGIIYTYLPLNKIKNVIFEHGDNRKMNIKLNSEEVIKLYFSNDKAIESFL